MADNKNIIVGASRVWIGTAAATKPAFVAQTSYNVTLNAASGWRDGGYTQEGIEFSNEPEFADVEVDQLLDAALVFKTGQTNTLSTTFAEATLENLLVVWGQQDSSLVASTGSTPAVLTVLGGQLGEAPIERQLIVVGNGKRNAATNYYNERTYHFTRAISVDQSAIAQRRTENAAIPVSFRLLPSDASGNPYGTFIDRERTATWATL